MVTIKQIADLCGVSRGTVDRVLNNRGNVKEEKRQLILDMAKKLNYQPNPAGKALAARKHKPVVGVLLPSEGIEFFDGVIDTMKSMAEKYEPYGMRVLWRTMRGYDPEKQCALLDELKGQIQALIINPINDPNVIHKLNEFIDDGIFVVMLNNDVELAKHHYYVGSDYYNGGQTAGALMRLIGPKSLKTGVLLGSMKVLGHCKRLAGFKEALANHPDFQLLGVKETKDDDMIAYERMQELLEEHPEINSLFVLSSGAYGACRALLAKDRRDLTIIAFDTINSTIDMMKQGMVQAAIYQHPNRQGSKAMRTAFDYLVNGIKPEGKQFIMKNEIRILENVL